MESSCIYTKANSVECNRFLELDPNAGPAAEVRHHFRVQKAVHPVRNTQMKTTLSTTNLVRHRMRQLPNPCYLSVNWEPDADLLASILHTALHGCPDHAL